MRAVDLGPSGEDAESAIDLDAVAPEAALGPDGASDAGSAGTDADTTPQDASAAGDAGFGACSFCHGSVENAAPPRDVTGNWDPTVGAAIGAHQAHLTPSIWHRDVACEDCHLVPILPGIDRTVPTHMNGRPDLDFGPRSQGGRYDTSTNGCGGVYCHGATLRGDAPGPASNREPTWTRLGGTEDACGQACHTLPPGGGHPAVTGGCEACHGESIARFDSTTPSASSWTNEELHINGQVEVAALSCTSCHGDEVGTNPAPPRGTRGERSTGERAVGAHRAHLGASAWHREVRCDDCHLVPTTTTHGNGRLELVFGGPSTADGAGPAYDPAGASCDAVYCHGSTLLGAVSGGTVGRTPVWTAVDGSFSACGSSCHTNPPASPHPPSTNCPLCHSAVIATFDPASPSLATWSAAALHIDGQVQVTAQRCDTCHGDAVARDPAPPLGTRGETETTARAVGAHQQHLGPSTWHRSGACTDCHRVPTDLGHSNGAVELVFSAPARNDGASPRFNTTQLSCSGVYCHGATLLGPRAGGVVARTPVWIRVDGTWDACGRTCHTLPPGGSHPLVFDQCERCHQPMARFDPANPAASRWANASLHVDGKIDILDLSCTSCHGDAVSGDPAPPRGTNNETATTEAAVGAHQSHLGPSDWHRAGECTDCHLVPASQTHTNSITEISFGGPSVGGGATPSYSSTSCSGVYCHGSTLLGARSGGVIARTPVWTEVTGRWMACGETCHTNPPGAPHPAEPDCRLCHNEVVSSYNAATRATVWAAAALHVDGVVESNTYHDLAGWRSPAGQPNHHGSRWFLTNAQRDEHNVACTRCHGSDLLGGPVGVTCDNRACHGSRDFRDCSFCHGTPPTQTNPPLGVAGEATSDTLAVGRHVAHLAASTTHSAIACGTCHVLPAANNLSHALQYQPSTGLAQAGHHGDVVFSPPAIGMTFDVSSVQGAPVTARASCIGACHSDGRGGAPVVTPYWAGGSWTAGSCGSCHAATPSSGRHRDHRSALCTECHPSPSTASHLDGGPDVHGAVSSLALTAPPNGTCGPEYSCSGSCHGEGHSSRCW
ncbi:MAG: hypothetical protein IT384_30235 [Deltaproteobacteria bacterium]|nr:hypothetical protein [Deltaproteobacteria bacterium]